MLANFFGKSKPVNFVFIIVLFLAYNFLDVFVINSSSFELKSIVNSLILFPGFSGLKQSLCIQSQLVK